jgi:hypothetical protein
MSVEQIAELPNCGIVEIRGFRAVPPGLGNKRHLAPQDCVLGYQRSPRGANDICVSNVLCDRPGNHATLPRIVIPSAARNLLFAK